MLLENKSPNSVKENFKTVIIYRKKGKNLKTIFNCLKSPELCVSLCWLVCMLYWCVTSLLVSIPLKKCDVCAVPLWDFQSMPANMNSLKSFVSLAAPKGEKVLGWL